MVHLGFFPKKNFQKIYQCISVSGVFSLRFRYDKTQTEANQIWLGIKNYKNLKNF